MPRAGVLTKARYVRLKKLNEIFTRGNYVMTELATMFGVPDATIHHDRKYIEENWWPKIENENTLKIRRKRVVELEQIKRFALESYQRSRQDKEEVTTRYEKRTCEECGGKGSMPKWKVCPNCEGLGFINEEIITRKVSGSPGNATFLNEARMCIVDLCKLEAVFKPQPVQTNIVLAGEVMYTHEAKFADIDPNLVIEAKTAMARLEEAANDDSINRGEAVDVEPA